jgi:SAM-dependent methyltransferase
MKAVLKSIVPLHIFETYHKVKRLYWKRIYGSKAAREVFTNIYDSNQWGGLKGEYFSGTGSDEHNALMYSEVIKEIIKERNVRKVVDLGCGDFTVGAKLQVEGVAYLGVDVVEKLIARNQQHYRNTNIQFQCLDIIEDELPEADMCLIRQVLQHLSNSQISTILRKRKKYKYVVITEHYPLTDEGIVPNKDKVHGYDIRLYYNSAVYLNLPPFNLNISDTLLDVEETAKGGRLKSFLIEN